MEKKYQVFVSSTYEDLQEERRKVMEALLGKNCFPVGMEYFPAANTDQFTVIKKLIDRCDYYILILGGRYGSIEPDSQKSYTQLEFEYAVDKGIPVASFYHAEPNKLPGDKIETTDAGKKKLEEFKKMVQMKLCDSWKEPYELAFKVNKSLDYLFENAPRIGWVKAGEISSAEANKELLKLRKDNEELVRQIKFLSSKTPEGTEYFRQGDDTFVIHYARIFPYGDSDQGEVFSKEVSWNQIFLSVCTTLLKPVTESVVRECLINSLLDKYDEIANDDFQTILIQLMALKLIETNVIQGESVYTYWVLTPYGRSAMVNLRAQRR